MPEPMWTHCRAFSECGLTNARARLEQAASRIEATVRAMPSASGVIV